jgi:hypothetical protein
MNRHPHRNLSVEEAVAVVTLAETGLSQRYIGHRLGVNQSTVSRVLKRHRETQQYSRRPGQGRKRVTTAAQDRFLMMQTLRERFITAPRPGPDWPQGRLGKCPMGRMPGGPAAGLALKDCIEGRKKLPKKAVKAEEEDHC